VQLFAARAAAAVPGFTVDDGNAAAVAGIVARLDGLPLAIELAAARVKLMPPQEILARLERSLALLVSVGRDVPDRQRTLRGAIAWSYELLSEGARRLLVAGSVFRGGIGLAGIEAVGTTVFEFPVLDGLQELVDHSLLRLSASSTPAPRYVMLETVREFAAEQLDTLPEAEAVHAAHAGYFRRLAEDLDPPPFWPARDGLDAMEIEHDNFRAALDWYRRADPAVALRLANRLTAFWSARGHFSEGRRRLGELLDTLDDVVTGPDAERTRALNGAAWLATDQGDHATAEALLEASIAQARAGHDVVAEATALFFRGRGRLVVGDFAAGSPDIARALQLQTAAGDDAGAAAATWFAGLSHSAQGDVEAAATRFERSAELSERLGLPPSARGPCSCWGSAASSWVICPGLARRSPKVCPPWWTSGTGSPSRQGSPRWPDWPPRAAGPGPRSCWPARSWSTNASTRPTDRP
jgi:non-specific serine/threonine protein kinase